MKVVLYVKGVEIVINGDFDKITCEVIRIIANDIDLDEIDCYLKLEESNQRDMLYSFICKCAFGEIVYPISAIGTFTLIDAFHRCSSRTIEEINIMFSTLIYQEHYWYITCEAHRKVADFEMPFIAHSVCSESLYDKLASIHLDSFLPYLEDNDQNTICTRDLIYAIHNARLLSKNDTKEVESIIKESRVNLTFMKLLEKISNTISSV